MSTRENIRLIARAPLVTDKRPEMAGFRLTSAHQIHIVSFSFKIIYNKR